jgi:quinol monooxygenase YgiN
MRRDPRKYIIGWLVCRPGKRDALMALAVPYAAECRREEGCLFFEMNPSVHEPDVIAVAECFASPEAHEVHLGTELFRRFWNRLPDFCTERRFENIFPDHVSPDRADFTAAR